MDFTKELSKKLNGKYDFLKVLKVVYDTTFSVCLINFIYPENLPILTDEQKTEIKTAVAEILNINGRIVCKFNKSFLDENIVKSKIKEFLGEEFDSLSTLISNNDISYSRNNFVIELIFNVNQTILQYIKNNDFCHHLKTYLCHNFCAEFIVDAKLDNSNQFDEQMLEQRAIDIQSTLEVNAKTPRYNVQNVNKLFGSEILPMPEYINGQVGEKFSLILAGNVSNLEQREYLPRKHKEKGIDEKLKMYKFKLSDSTGAVDCVHFCTKASQKHFGLVEDGTHILCLGNYVKRDNGTMQYMIKSISLCTKVQSEEVETPQPEIQDRTTYQYVKPLPYKKQYQDNMFNDDNVAYPSWITEKSWVVFDVETTGLIPDKNDITEIGAVKIENGKITQVFQTLCKPHIEISEEITKLTGITNQMVENERYCEDIIEDFLLFAGDSVMVGYNVKFDYQFIQFTAQRIGKSFKNEFRDCMGDAKDKLFLPNYKLGTVVASLGIDLSNAHRALYDATATAEAFLKLSLMDNLGK
ncbi:MAG: hypothetical protein E7378_00200 [Clostridiales bacterium]|nr:hypothetical protein [Clostridiales bacterium]